MSEIGGIVSNAAASSQLKAEVGMKALGAALDQQKQAGAAAISLLEQAAEVSTQAVAAATGGDGVGANLDLLA
ncbi:hypothetical protein [Mucisphaera sp.]|uniref:hypothetical protein n=1 Tax=Mucisphaera sp. TaxID=2913024 RepID=UPI003D121578